MRQTMLSRKDETGGKCVAERMKPIVGGYERSKKAFGSAQAK